MQFKIGKSSCSARPNILATEKEDTPLCSGIVSLEVGLVGLVPILILDNVHVVASYLSISFKNPLVVRVKFKLKSPSS